MRTGVFWLICVAVLVIAIPLLAQDSELGPGGVHVRGFTDEYGQFYLDVSCQPALPSMYTILAAKIYSEPSHTLLGAVVDASASASVLTQVQVEHPRALSVTPFGPAMARLNLAAPPMDDQTIKVDYVILKDGAVSTMTISMMTFPSLGEFDLQTTPMIGGKFKHCGYCSVFCGCVYCSGPEHTVCCPYCDIYCGMVKCTP